MIDRKSHRTGFTEWSALVDHPLTEQFVEGLIDAMKKITKCLGENRA